MQTLIVTGSALVGFCGIKTWRWFHQAYIRAPKQIALLRESNRPQDAEQWEQVRRKSKDAFQWNAIVLMFAILSLAASALGSFFISVSTAP